MNISKLKAAFALLTGGIGGIIKYLLNLFNEQVLSKIPNKEVGAKYLRDAQAVNALLRAILENHIEDISMERRLVLAAIVAAIDELAKALEDFTVNETEFDAILARVNEAIDAWKKTKK